MGRIDDLEVDELAQPQHAFANDFADDWRAIVRDYREENARIRRRFAEMEHIIQARRHHSVIVNVQEAPQQQQQQQQQPQPDNNIRVADEPIEPPQMNSAEAGAASGQPQQVNLEETGAASGQPQRMNLQEAGPRNE